MGIFHDDDGLGARGPGYADDRYACELHVEHGWSGGTAAGSRCGAGPGV